MGLLVNVDFTQPFSKQAPVNKANHQLYNSITTTDEHLYFQYNLCENNHVLTPLFFYF